MKWSDLSRDFSHARPALSRSCWVNNSIFSFLASLWSSRASSLSLSLSSRSSNWVSVELSAREEDVWSVTTCYQNKYSSVPSIPARIRISIYFYKTLRPIRQVQISSRYCPLKREQKYWYLECSVLYYWTTTRNDFMLLKVFNLTRQ